MKLFFPLVLIGSVAAAETPSWPPVEYAHVVAYCYDSTRDSRGSEIVFADGTHHRGIIAPFTRNLMPGQAKRLLALLNPEKEPIEQEEDCYDPHHALVFYDKEWKPLASIDICLSCADFRARPAHPNKELDWEAFAALFRSLGMPVLEGEAGYQELFLMHQKPILAEETEHPVKRDPEPTEPFDPFAPDG